MMQTWLLGPVVSSCIVGGRTLHDEVGVNSKMGPQLTDRHGALTMDKWVGAASEARLDMTSPPWRREGV